MKLNQEGGNSMSKSAAEREVRGRVGEFCVASKLCGRKMFHFKSGRG